MGQAKHRGTPEERREKAIALAQAIADHRYQQEMERERLKMEEWEKLTPKEREARVNQATFLARVYSEYAQVGKMMRKTFR